MWADWANRKAREIHLGRLPDYRIIGDDFTELRMRPTDGTDEEVVKAWRIGGGQVFELGLARRSPRTPRPRARLVEPK